MKLWDFNGDGEVDLFETMFGQQLTDKYINCEQEDDILKSNSYCDDDGFEDYNREDDFGEYDQDDFDTDDN
jgi:hypothetical protein